MSMFMPSKLPPIHHLAPAAPGGARRDPSGQHHRACPGLDERLVQPEGRDEIVRGRRVVAAPALAPHADVHSKLDYLIQAHVPPGYVGASDLLTRASDASDFATDACIRRAGIDVETQQRYLEELAFEVVHRQSLRDVRERAEDLAARGVRRIFAIVVQRGEVLEWSPARGRFDLLDPGSVIEDRCLSRPLPVRALLDAAEADNAVARALVDKRNPVIEEVWQRGLSEGLRRQVHGLCELLDIEIPIEQRAALQQMSASALEALADDIKRDRRWPW